MQVIKLHEQQGIKPATMHTNAEARIAVLEAKLRISSPPIDGDVKKTVEETPEEPVWWRNRGNPVVNHQALGSMQGTWLTPRVLKGGPQYELCC